MRAYDFALLVMLFAAVMGLLDNSEVWPDSQLDMGRAEINTEDYNQLPNDATSTEDEGGFFERLNEKTFGQLGIIGSVITRIFYIQDIIAGAFGNSEEAVQVAWAIQVGIWLTYIVGAFQAITGRSAKSME